jgi:hypothetical protein
MSTTDARAEEGSSSVKTSHTHVSTSDARAKEGSSPERTNNTVVPATDARAKVPLRKNPSSSNNRALCNSLLPCYMQANNTELLEKNNPKTSPTQSFLWMDHKINQRPT